ncbi:MAG: hypothetical protein OEN23_06660 [Paracoccaceae bacterium]|nr:hypothetical protein [Paracoccaceae bacterium]
MLALAPLPALAHSFQLGVIVPLTGPDSQRGTEALDGLRLATRERDGHPDETSDGHLGGLDSHLRPIDSARASSAEELKALVAERRLDLVTIATDRVDAGRLADAFADPAMPAFCPPGSGPVPIDDLEGAGARPFATSFRGEFGYPPTPEAAIGYNAGRAVDAAVRELGGVTDKAALVRLCSRAE